MPKPNVGIIVGSNRPGRVCLSIAQWLQTAMQNQALNVSLIDLAATNLPFLDEPDIPARGNYQNAHTKAWSQTISGCDGFVFLFPQYNWGYPAVLKNALDYLYKEWENKPVSILCYGGHGGTQGAIAMRLVTMGLHMKPMAINIPLVIDEEMFSDGKFKDIGTALEPYKTLVQNLSNEFVDSFAKNRLC